MATMVLMPQMGVSEESAVLAQYLVKEGETVKAGQALFSLETGKSAFECLAEVDGCVLKFFAAEGDEVNVGVPVMAIGEPGEAVEAPTAEATSAPQTEAAPEVAPAAAPQVAAAPQTVAVTANSDGMIKASPRAKMLAAETGANLQLAAPTGPEGRIIERDVKALLKSGVAVESAAPVEAAAPAPATAAAAPAAAYEDKPLSRIRKVIAENMHKSLSEMAQLTLNSSFDATAIIAFRKKAKAAKNFGLEEITLNDCILYAVSRTLLDYPEINANLLGDKMRYFHGVQLGVAIDTPRGLMVPVMRDAEKMSLSEMSRWVKDKAALCREGAIPPEELSGGSFTVSNLGSMGIESFTPVVNPPQTAILGVDTFMLRPREVNGEITFYQAMGLSLTIDHRAVDGAPGAKFLKALANNLENFDLLLAR